jgi:predicted regulator of Ras-like GTPase activity (Roadblock/LC7/MglB family)
MKKTGDRMDTKQGLFEEVLERMNKQGNFGAAVLSMKDGLPLASSPTYYEDEMAAAMVTLFNEAIKRFKQHLGLPQVDEISIVGDDRTRLVCRYFAVDGHELMLTVLTPPDQSYRLLTNRIIKEIERIWLG